MIEVKNLQKAFGGNMVLKGVTETIEKGEKIACLEARRHYSWYLKGLRNASYYKEQVAKVETLDRLREITRELIDNFK